ncbi:MAG: CD1871A family CXXC motif-containing protein [Eubacteriales bacterium]
MGKIRENHLRAIRIILMIAALLFIGIGLFNGEYQAVFTKATNICLECIGIG